MPNRLDGEGMSFVVKPVDVIRGGLPLPPTQARRAKGGLITLDAVRAMRHLG
jgi:hypothetical protein